MFICTNNIPSQFELGITANQLFIRTVQLRVGLFDATDFCFSSTILIQNTTVTLCMEYPTGGVIGMND